MKNFFKSYRDLEVWQKSMVLAKGVYQVTSSFPTDEKFGLTNQMRRAAVSIPSNLAEGHARSGTQEFKHFISIAIGSVAELETQILLSVELGYLNRDPENDLLVKLDTIGKMLRGLHKSLNKKEKM
jgi:four helix bundle protein